MSSSVSLERSREVAASFFVARSQTIGELGVAGAVKPQLELEQQPQLGVGLLRGDGVAPQRLTPSLP